MTKHTTIKKLTIRNFRGLKAFDWLPASGMNLILGGGDVGKTTVLEAIALLFSPTNSFVVSENDYWDRLHADGFEIEAVIAPGTAVDFSTQKNFAWPWHWDGKDAVMPADPGDDKKAEPVAGDPVFRVRVRGAEDLELIWEMLQPSGDAEHFSVAVRRKIGLIRMAAEDRNDRDLRLVYGSALDRLFADPALRARIGKVVAGMDLGNSLEADGRKKLADLDEQLNDESLPHDLSLGLTTTQGLSIGALIGLLAKRGGVSLPLSTWGAGTRRMAALEIASATEKEASIKIIDEIERGLEPYRLRKLVRLLLSKSGQSFVTTHSPVAITASDGANLWYLAADAVIGALPIEAIRAQQNRDPETFLAKFPLIAEGPTEVGFLKFLFKRAFGCDPLDHGVRVCDGQGNQACLGLLEAMNRAGLRFGALMDDEGDFAGRWKVLSDALGPRMHQWKGGCTEQRVISAISDANLDKLLLHFDGKLHHERLRTLADRLFIVEGTLEGIKKAAEEKGMDFRALLIAAASGSKAGAPKEQEKSWGNHGKRWFKSNEGGWELAMKMVALGAWPKVREELLPLINAFLKLAGLPEKVEIEL